MPRLRREFAYFDRFDICEAYAVLEWLWHNNGWLRERPSNQRRMEAISVQLARVRFKPRPDLEFGTLEPNGRAIFRLAQRRLGLDPRAYSASRRYNIKGVGNHAESRI